MTVQIFVPCFIDQLYPNVGFSMVKVLEKAGCTVSYNTNQTCCGQPAFNAGFWNDAKAVCQKFVADFDGTDPIVVPSASCAGFIKNYYEKVLGQSATLTALQNRVFEFSSFLVHVVKTTRFGAVFNGKATYHDSCAGLRECNIKQEPRLLLQQVEGLELVEMDDVETCCGFGGSFAVKFEAISAAMADQKTHHAAQTGAQYVISTDTSCLMHLEGYAKQQGRPLEMLHLADVLASGWS
jgi:L-lactate dehydrogenase complex protein LldE